jgi:hypothetical protein
MEVSILDHGQVRRMGVPPEFGASEKGQSLISTYRSLAITLSTSGFEKLSTGLNVVQSMKLQKNIENWRSWKMSFS